jgi:hypothetical protein
MTGNPLPAERATWAVPAARACLLVLAIWLGLSLLWVGIEFDDGYAAMVNAQYFLGLPADYIWSRGPLLGLLLVPAEWLAHRLQMHPLTVLPHHVVFVSLHLLHAWLVWHLLARSHGTRPESLLAWLATVPCVAFAGQAAFISTDILPGSMLLGMLVLAVNHLERPRWSSAIALIVIGFLAAAIKHILAALWVAVLLGLAVVLLTERRERRAWRAWGQLLACAAVSAVLTIALYAWALASTYPETPWWQRPLLQALDIEAYFAREGPIASIIFQGVYRRNLWAFGLLACALVLPGLWFSWRSGDRLLRAGVVAWLFMATLLQLVPFKETRYLLVLAPLTALLLVPAIRSLIALRRAYLWPMAALLAIDLTLASGEALRLRQPFYKDQVPAFLADLPPASDPRGQMLMTGFLNFVAPDRWAYFGDRYHRIVHLNISQLAPLLGYPPGRIRRFEELPALTRELFAGGDFLIFVNGTIGRVPPIAPDNRTTMQPNFLQFVARAEPIRLARDGDHYLVEGKTGPRPWLLLRSGQGQGEPVLSFDRFPSVDVVRLEGLASPPDVIDTLGFNLSALCDTTGCRRFDPPADGTP